MNSARTPALEGRLAGARAARWAARVPQHTGKSVVRQTAARAQQRRTGGDSGSGSGGGGDAPRATPPPQQQQQQQQQQWQRREPAGRRSAGYQKEEARRARFFESGSGGSGESGDSGGGPSSSGSSGGQSRGIAIRAPSAPAPGGPRRYTQIDKTQLTTEEAEDVAARLRRAGPAAARRGGGGGGRGWGPIRLYRYAVDDLRLLKALDEAQLEGSVVVVDSPEGADLAIAAQTKRTGKAMDLGPARRAAAAAGVPFVALKTISAQRLVAALAPLLGPEAAAAAAAAADAAAAPRTGWQAGNGGGDGPRIIPDWEVAAGGGDELLALLWGPRGGAPAGAAGAAAAAGASSSAALSAGEALAAPLAARAARLGDPWAWTAAGDAEDDRSDAIPRNPNARAFAREPPPRRPLRHGSRIQKRKLEKHWAEKNADW